MTDKEIYEKFDHKNSWSKCEIVTLTPSQLEKIILTACKYAREDGFINGREYQINQEKMKPKTDTDIFSQMFGGLKK